MAYGFAGPVYPVHPRRGTSAACGRTRPCSTCRTTVDLAVSPSRARCPRRRRAVRAQGRARCGRDVRRFRRAGSSRAPIRSGAGRELERKLVASPARTACASSAELPRRRQRRPVRTAQRDDRAPGAGPRPGGLLLPVRRPGRRDPRGGEALGARASTFVSAGNRPMSAATTCCSTGPVTRDRRRPALPGELRQPAKFARLARRVARTKPVVAVKTGRYAAATPLWPPGPCRCRRSGCRRCSRSPASSGSTRSPSCSTSPSCSPTSRCRRGRGSRRSRTPARSACSLRMPVPPPGSTVWRPWTWAGRGRAHVHGRRTDAIDRADALVAVFAPALATPGDDYAQALAEIAATSRVPVLTTFLGTEGVPAPLRRSGDDKPGEVLAAPCRRTRRRNGRYARWPLPPGTPHGAGDLPAHCPSWTASTGGGSRGGRGGTGDRPGGGSSPGTSRADCWRRTGCRWSSGGS
jgi:hypothetical protein